jgi:Lipopolysaccharide-assembly
MPLSGSRRTILAALLTVVIGAGLSGCLYGFAGGGLPPSVRTIAIIPFDNQTASAELQQEFMARLRRELRSRLGVREAGEAQASAVVRGLITRYEPDIPIAFSSDRTQSVAARRKLMLTIDIEIFDQSAGRVLWARKGMSAEGEYAERAEADGRRQAIEKLVNDVIEGAQSQW